MEQTTATRLPIFAPSADVALVGYTLPVALRIVPLPIIEAEEEYAATLAAFHGEDEDEEGYVEILALEAEAREEWRMVCKWGRG